MSWAELYPWRPPAPGQAVIRHVYEQVRGAIHSGALKPGGRLPSSRDLAAALRVARASVVAAYDQLFAEGYTEGRTGSGTYVAADLSAVIEPEAPRPAPALPLPPLRLSEAARSADAFVIPSPSTEARPFSNGRTLMDARAKDGWLAATRRALRTLPEHHFGYGEAAGDPALRSAIADYLRAARGVVCTADQVIVTAGAQHGIDLVIRVLLEPGDTVWVEDPGYPATWQALKATGARLAPVPVDRAGLVVAEGVGSAPAARMAVVTPSHQFPLGVTLSMPRRLELIGWARAAGAWIIEDDYASEFRYAGPPLASLQGLDGGERVIYVGTLNKALFPGLRLGYLVAPAALIPALTRARHLMDRHPSSVTQAVLLEFMKDGQFAAHIRRRRVAYRAQRDALAAALEARLGRVLELDVPDQGMSLIARLRDGRSDVEVEDAATASGLSVRAISRLHHKAKPRSGLLLGFTGFPVAAMAPGVERLARVLET